MGYFLIFLGLAMFIVLAIVGFICLIKRNGKAKKSFMWALVGIIVLIVGVIAAPKENDSADSSNSSAKTSKVAKKESKSNTSKKKKLTSSEIVSSKEESSVLAKASSEGESREKENMKKPSESSSSSENSNIKEAKSAKSQLISDIEEYGKSKNVDHVLIRSGNVLVYMTDNVNNMSIDEFKSLAKEIYDHSVQLGHQDEFAVYEMRFFVNGSQILAKVDANTHEVEMLGEE